MIVKPGVPAVSDASKYRAGTLQQGHACASIAHSRHASSDPLQPSECSGGACAGARTGRNGHRARRDPQPRSARYSGLRDLPPDDVAAQSRWVRVLDGGLAEFSTPEQLAAYLARVPFERLV